MSHEPGTVLACGDRRRVLPACTTAAARDAGATLMLFAAWLLTGSMPVACGYRAADVRETATPSTMPRAFVDHVDKATHTGEGGHPELRGESSGGGAGSGGSGRAVGALIAECVVENRSVPSGLEPPLPLPPDRVDGPGLRYFGGEVLKDRDLVLRWDPATAGSLDDPAEHVFLIAVHYHTGHVTIVDCGLMVNSGEFVLDRRIVNLLGPGGSGVVLLLDSTGRSITERSYTGWR